MTYPHTVDIERATWTADGEGGDTKAWAAIHRGVPAFVQPRSGSKQQSYAAADVVITHDVYLGHSGLKSDDRLKYGVRYLAVVYVRRMCERSSYYHCECKEESYGA